MSVEDAAKELGIGEKRLEDIEGLIENIVNQRLDFVKERGMGAIGPLMGEVMKELRGIVDGEVASSLLKKKIEEHLDQEK